MQLRLDRVRDWKTFERLCADLLEAERFAVSSEPSIDTSGEDLRAQEEYRSHDGTRSVSLSWRVQCKHYAISQRNLDRREIETILVGFAAVRRPNDGLLLMISTDITEPAKRVLDEFLAGHQDARVQVWNGRHIAAKLDQHAQLVGRYGLRDEPSSDYLKPFDALAEFTPASAFVVSDQSALAHDFTHGLRRAGFEVMSLPVWNYQHDYRRGLLLDVVERGSPSLVALFLGDSFGVPIPSGISRLVLNILREGGGVLLFPFLAWTLHRGQPDLLREICPVTLADDKHSITTEQYWQMVAGGYRAGDFKFLLDTNGFAENEYMELRPSEAAEEFAAKLSTATFGLRHSFEYLRPTDSATVQWADITGNPFVVTRQYARGHVAYVNTCCHECMSLSQMLSPLQSQHATGQVFANVVEWLMTRNRPTQS
jgi:Restriction endonuclease